MTKHPLAVAKPLAALLCSLILGTLLLGQAQPAYVAKTAVNSQIYLPIIHEGHAPALCRFGANVIRDAATLDLADLRLGWYVDYGASLATIPGLAYVRVIRLTQTGTASYTHSPNAQTILDVVAAYPGGEWLIGNEPDRRDFQDDIEPQLYAVAYHDLYQLIKTADSTAQIFAGTIVQPTPLRLQYLDRVLAAYQQTYGTPLPADGWSIHNFILNEVSCDHDPANCWGAGIPPGMNAPFGEVLSIEDNDNFDIFAARIHGFRQWLADNGYAGLPVHLSEYGILMPADFGFPPQRVNQFMDKTFTYMLNAADPLLGDPHDNYRLIQKWSWYSTGAPGDVFNGYLYEPTSNALSPMGAHLAAFTAALPEEVDFYPASLGASLAAETTTTLTAVVANSGNLATTQLARVRFYDGNPAAGGQLIGTEQTVQLAGCGQAAAAQVAWPNITPGDYVVYAVVETAVAETNSQNNTLHQTITIPLQP